MRMRANPPPRGIGVFVFVLNVFRYFVLCQAALAFCRCNANSLTNPSQIDQNGGQERSVASGFLTRH